VAARPIDAEMIRRGLLPKDRGGGFWSAWRLVLAACTGDFIWALAFPSRRGPAQLGRDPAGASDRKSRTALILAVRFAIGAWKIYRAIAVSSFKRQKANGAALSIWSFCGVDESWNVGFWLAVIGSQPAQSAKCATVPRHRGRGCPRALTWGVVLCTAFKFGAQIFSHPNWQVATEAIAAAVMLWFAIRLLLHFP